MLTQVAFYVLIVAATVIGFLFTFPCISNTFESSPVTAAMDNVQTFYDNVNFCAGWADTLQYPKAEAAANDMLDWLNPFVPVAQRCSDWLGDMLLALGSIELATIGLHIFMTGFLFRRLHLLFSRQLTVGVHATCVLLVGLVLLFVLVCSFAVHDGLVYADALFRDHCPSNATLLPAVEELRQAAAGLEPGEARNVTLRMAALLGGMGECGSLMAELGPMEEHLLETVVPIWLTAVLWGSLWQGMLVLTGLWMVLVDASYLPLAAPEPGIEDEDVGVDSDQENVLAHVQRSERAQPGETTPLLT
jgi:hypothetical protein